MVWRIENRRSTRSPAPDPGDFLSRIERERHGVSTTEAEALRRSMGMSVEVYARLLGIKPAAYKLKRSRLGRFTGALGYAIGDLEDMLRKAEELVSPNASDFDLRRWFSGWIHCQQPALGGWAPVELLDTPAGRSMVTRVLGAMGSGVYL